MRNLASLILLFSLIFSCKEKESNNKKTAPNYKILNEETIDIKDNASIFTIENIYGIWTDDLNSPHANFKLSKKSFYVVDYDGNGDFQYKINDNKITVFYPDTVETGLIKKAINDSLIIYWQSGEYKTYLRWKE